MHIRNFISHAPTRNMAATGYSETMVGYETPYLRRPPASVLQVAYLFRNTVRVLYAHNLSSTFFWNMAPRHWMLEDVSSNSGSPETSGTNYPSDAVQYVRRTDSSTASLRTLKNSHVRNLSSQGTTTSIGFWHRHVLFHFSTPLKMLLPPPQQYLFTFAVRLHRNPWTLVTVRGITMIRELNKRQHDFKQISCNSFRMQISRPKQYLVIARSN
jgi:hypothetical protein